MVAFLLAQAPVLATTTNVNAPPVLDARTYALGSL